MSTIECYFDYGCPWCYIADYRVRDVALRNGVSIDWRPVSLSRVLTATGGSLAAMSADRQSVRGRYAVKDLLDWAGYWGLPVTRNISAGAQDVHAAVCGAVVALEEGCLEQYSEAVYRARYNNGEDIASLDRIREIAGSLGLAADVFIERLGSEAVNRRIEENSDELIARDGFGVPTFFVGDNMFYGNDRMPLIEWALSPVRGDGFVAPGAHGQV